MRDFSKIAPQFWTGETGRRLRKLGPDALLMALYLVTNQHANALGLYYLPLGYVCNDLGSPLEGATKTLRRVCEAGFCEYDAETEMVWIFEMAKFQLGTHIKSTDNRAKWVRDEWSRVCNSSFCYDFLQKYGTAYGIGEPENNKGLQSPSEAPSKPLRSFKKEKEKEKESVRVSYAGARAREDDPVPPQKRPESVVATESASPSSVLSHTLPVACASENPKTEDSSANLLALPGSSAALCPETFSREGFNAFGYPQNPDAKVIFYLPMKDKVCYAVCQEELDFWKSLYPHLDLYAVFHDIRQWATHNASGVGTLASMGRVVAKWLAEQGAKAGRSLPVSQLPDFKHCRDHLGFVRKYHGSDLDSVPWVTQANEQSRGTNSSTGETKTLASASGEKPLALTNSGSADAESATACGCAQTL